MVRPLVGILPGRYKKHIDISSKNPNEILKILDQPLGNFDTILLSNLDVWRYFDLREEIFNHPALLGKNVFLQTLGYTNTKVKDNCWEISYPGFYWSRQMSKKSFSAFGQNLNYGFSCLNNNTPIHRLLLGYNLYKSNLTNEIIFSQNDHNIWWKKGQPAPDIISQIPDIQEYLNLLPIRYKEPDSTVFEFSSDHSVNHDAYTQAYCNIVTESECEEYPYHRNINLPIITEKSYKPFLSGQVPIMLAARGHIEYLKSLGFEMMEDLLPMSYDDMPVLQKIENIVTIVSKGKDFIEDFYFSHVKEIQHNFELVNSNKVENLILQRIKDIL